MASNVIFVGGNKKVCTIKLKILNSCVLIKKIVTRWSGISALVNHSGRWKFKAHFKALFAKMTLSGIWHFLELGRSCIKAN